MLNGLDLFSGIGGLTIALSPWARPVAYCEQDRYCQAVLLSRMFDKSIPTAGVWDDVRTINAAELLAPIDIIYGGFPCQDISVAGNGRGLEGERSGLVFEIFRLTKEIKPTFIFLENVPAIRTRGAERVGKELAALGYDCRWDMLSAYDVGAPHLRERWFCLAHNPYIRDEDQNREIRKGKAPEPSGDCTPDAERQFLRDKQRRGSGEGRQGETEPRDHGASESLADADGIPSNSRQQKSEVWRRNSDTRRLSWWDSEPNVGRVAHGISAWLDRVDYSYGLEKMREYGLSSMENPAKTLSRLWKDDGAPEVFKWGDRVTYAICSPEILLAFMRRIAVLYTQKYLSQASKEASRGKMRGMSFDHASASAPCRPRTKEQQPIQYSNALQGLSQLLAQNCATQWQENSRAYALHRIDRIKGLGNAVVPAQAREAFVRLMGL